MTWITKNLIELSERELERAGLPARELAVLAKAGLPLPPAFLVAADLYATVAERLGLAERERELRDRDWQRDDPELRGELAKVRESISREALPADAGQALIGASASLGTDLVDVTLSPLLASPDAAAIAGLSWRARLIPPEAVPDAVPEAWGALWRTRPFLFRKRVGIGPASVAAAVLVSASTAAPLEGQILLGEENPDGSFAWVIQVDELARRGAPEAAEVRRRRAEGRDSPLTASQAEALTIFADVAAQVLGEPRSMTWRFDGSRFTITGLAAGAHL